MFRVLLSFLFIIALFVFDLVFIKVLRFWHFQLLVLLACVYCDLILVELCSFLIQFRLIFLSRAGLLEISAFHFLNWGRALQKKYSLRFATLQPKSCFWPNYNWDYAQPQVLWSYRSITFLSPFTFSDLALLQSGSWSSQKVLCGLYVRCLSHWVDCGCHIDHKCQLSHLRWAWCFWLWPFWRQSELPRLGIAKRVLWAPQVCFQV